MDRLLSFAKFSRKRPLLACVVGMGIIFVALSIYASFLGKKIVWLSASQALMIARTGQLNGFSGIKYKLIDRIAPLRRWFARRPYNIHLETTLVLAPSTFPQEIGIGEPVATNSSGVRAWIVTPADAPKFQMKFTTEWETNPCYEMIDRPLVNTCDGIPCSLMSTVPAYEGTITQKIYPTTPEGDFEINIVPETASDAYNLTVAITLFRPAFNTVVPCDTITPCGFRIRIPKNSILVTDCGPFKDRSGKPYWLVVTPSTARISYPTVGPVLRPST